MLDWPARLLLSPVLIAQALKVRRTAQSLPEAAGPRSGSCGAGPDLRLRIIGDSSAAGVGVAEQSQALSGQLSQQLAAHFRVHWQLDAITGATTASTLTRLRPEKPDQTDIIVTALGVNDATRLIPAAKWQRQQTELLHRIHALFAPRQIYMSGVPPLGDFPLLPHPLRWTLGRQAKRYDQVQRLSIDAMPNVTLMPFDRPLDPALMATDGFHPGPEVYTLWAKELASRIISDWPEL